MKLNAPLTAYGLSQIMGAGTSQRGFFHQDVPPGMTPYDSGICPSAFVRKTGIIAQGFCVSSPKGSDEEKISGPYMLIIPSSMDEVIMVGRNAVSKCTSITNKTRDSIEYDFESNHSIYGKSAGKGKIDYINTASNSFSVPHKILRAEYTNGYESGSECKGVLYFYEPAFFKFFSENLELELDSLHRIWRIAVDRTPLNIHEA